MNEGFAKNVRLALQLTTRLMPWDGKRYFQVRREIVRRARNRRPPCRFSLHEAGRERLVVGFEPSHSLAKLAKYYPGWKS